MPAGVSAWTPLANITLGASASTVTFSSISGSYRDLVLIVNAKNTTSNTALRARLNADSGSNYSYVILEGTGSVTQSVTGTTTEFGFGPNATSDSQQVVHFLDYSATDKHKLVIGRMDFPSSYVDLNTYRWANTAAITQIQLYPLLNQFAAGSTFALYGVSA